MSSPVVSPRAASSHSRLHDVVTRRLATEGHSDAALVSPGRQRRHTRHDKDSSSTSDSRRGSVTEPTLTVDVAQTKKVYIEYLF